MIRRLRLRLATGDADRGLSLTELVVAAALSLLILAMVGTVFAQTAQLTSSATQNRDSNTVASNIAGELREVIGLAIQIPVQGSSTPLPAIKSGTATSLVINALVDVADPANPAPTQVTFAVDAATGMVTESRCVAKSVSGFWTFTSCASTSTRKLGGAIVAPGSGQSPLFSYLDGSGGTVAFAGGSLPATSLTNVASIIVSVKILAAGSKTAPVYLSSNIGMPNVGLQQGNS